MTKAILVLALLSACGGDVGTCSDNAISYYADERRATRCEPGFERFLECLDTADEYCGGCEQLENDWRLCQSIDVCNEDTPCPRPDRANLR